MQISAIKAYSTLSSVHSGKIGCTRVNENTDSMTFFKNKGMDPFEGDIYELIAEWKTFCQQQIINGEADFIA